MPSLVEGETPDAPFLVVETMPRFQGSESNDFRNWIQNQIVYPCKAVGQQLSGRVIVQFVIETDASLSNIEIVESPDEILGKKVIRILKMSPKWTPGMQRVKNVRVRLTLPVSFHN